MKKILFTLLVLVSIFSCKKSDNPQDNNSQTTAKIIYTADSANALPGIISTLKANQFIKKDTCTVELGGGEEHPID